MNVFLLRHGACEKEAPGGDAERRLTPEGRKAIENSVPGMKSLIGQVDYILTSPFARAVETADIVADAFKCRGFVEEMPELADRGSEEALDVMLNKLVGKENIVVVGHMPHLGEVAQYFLGIESETTVELKKGGMARIYIKGFPGPGEGKLHWVMTSGELKRSGETSD